jgi:cell fate regulator YaaT (PSP1 superfamily)
MPIYPLPLFEADLAAAEEDRQAYERLKTPKTLVVRFGSMKLVGEFPWEGSAKPGCGSKIVVRTHRGTELGEMLTSTCPNAGCSKSVTRKDMLEYIENSGGRDYPFSTEGRALRIATAEDLDRQSKLEQSRHELTMGARKVVEQLGLPLKVVDAEPILGGERLTFYFSSEQRIDFRELARLLGQEHRTRVDLRQVGARDEARLTADYERCGQYCCCKNFLKVLKPVSMKSAKTQKATLDPLKISGRCGRLMCCLRYEDQTYEELVKRLPRRKSRVGTPEGDGTVIDGQILTQLVLVLLDGQEKQIAVPVENLTPPRSAKPPPVGPPGTSPAPGGPPAGSRRDRPRGVDREMPPRPPREPAAPAPPPRMPVPARDPAPAEPARGDEGLLDDAPETDGPPEATTPSPAPPGGPSPPQDDGVIRRRRRRRRRRGGGAGGPGGPPPQGGPPAPPPPPAG